MSFLPAQYDPRVVVASVAIASFASYVALDLTKRVRSPDRALALGWWGGGSLVMGTGIWSMHFVGMLAFSLPIPLGYLILQTLLSWAAGVVVSGIALGIASYGQLTWPRLAGGALAMGAGICTMHYTGMAALDMSPGIVWHWPLVFASAGVAVLASGAALAIFFWLRRFGDARRSPYQALAAIIMGLAISGMHYTGMAAAQFPLDSLCRSAGELIGSTLGVVIAVASLAMLLLTWLTSMLDARMQSRASRLSASLQAANEHLQAANDELQRRAFLDPLTGLANRVLFEDRLAHAVARNERATDRIAERNHEKLAVVFVDLDGFKPVNDSYGHGAGDLVLKLVGQRLRHVARDSDTLARVGGDEFLLLMEDVGSAADCASVARRMVDVLRQPFDIGDKLVEISGSVGIAVYPDHGMRDRLVAHADAAMYAAKRAGGNTFVLFESHMDLKAEEQLSLQRDLRHAIARGELELHYQPKVDSIGGQIHGVEALLRWRHAERGMIGPNVFIPIAERFGLIAELGRWVIDEACRQIRQWSDQGALIRVSINLSAHQLREEDLVRRISESLTRHDVKPSHLLCEITESVAMEDIKATQRTFESLAHIGVYLSIDDFGTGYSSLSYLRQLPARQLKIDRSFVNDLESSLDARAVVDAVVRLAHALDLRVVAEGVETPAQQHILVDLGCDELQGFLFARPMLPADLLQWARGIKPAGAVEFAPSVTAAFA